MKRKLDFVTNSSSTSFCAWGIILDNDFEQLPDTIKKMIYDEYVEYEKKYNNEYISYEEFLDGYEEIDWSWNMGDALKKINLTCTVCHSDSVMYIGIAPDQIPENKTLLEAKKETKQKLKDLGFDVSDFIYILESWYD